MTVLALRALGLGDLLTAVPALRALAAGHPGHRLVLATTPAMTPLATLLPGVDEVVPVGELAPLPDEVAGADVAVNLHGSGPESHRLLLAIRPRRLVAFATPALPEVDGPRWDPDEHEVRRWCRLVRASGLAADPHDLAVPVPDGPVPPGARGATVVHPGAKAGARRWPWQRFAAVARHEHDAGRRVVVTGGPDEVALARRVAAAARLPGTAVLAGRSDLPDLLRIVAVASRVVCGDTGVAHLATATGTPSVVLFGPTPPSHWGPLDRGGRHRVLWRGERGDPLGDDPFPPLLDIQVPEVLDALAVVG